MSIHDGAHPLVLIGSFNLNTSEYNAVKRELENAQQTLHSIQGRNAPKDEIESAENRLRAAMTQLETIQKYATPEERRQVSIDSAIIRGREST